MTADEPLKLHLNVYHQLNYEDEEEVELLKEFAADSDPEYLKEILELGAGFSFISKENITFDIDPITTGAKGVWQARH